MEGALNRILARRRSGLHLWWGRRAATLSVSLHLVLLAAIFFGPVLFAERRKPLEYVTVTVVPAAALPQPKPEPEPPPPPSPKPKPKPEPEPEPPAEAPVLPTMEPEPEPEPEPPPPEPDAAAEIGLARDGPATVQGVDDPDFVYGYYLDRMLSLIRERWTKPPAAAETELVLHFRILRNGHVDQLRIVTPSGLQAFDLAGLRAVQSTSPLPPLPQGYRKSSLGVTLTMR